MKLKGQTIVLIPWFDSDGMKQWLRLTFNGEMDSRFMYKTIVNYLKKEFNKKVDKEWIKASCPIMNEYIDNDGKSKQQKISDDESFPQLVEDWIKRLEDEADANETVGNSILSDGDNESTELPVRSVQDSN